MIVVKKLFYISVFIFLFVKTGFPGYEFNLFSDGDPELYRISAPVPNPVTDYAEVYFNLPESCLAEIAIYNFTGVKVKSESVTGGIGKVNFEVYDLQNGVYFVCLILDGKSIDSKKLVKK